ncbi:DNA-binding protein SMUBP-2-like isoform X2 [Limulus polyphemus]|uniref:DNA helicase n=1 Tax=Limulus polyphemus TaxID=6850 RepID=A0ABM1T1Y9_LIMPO|nr:DNA-binding protein SMUBP-2-like isoform X2 [Limulus polyphemus]
MVIYINRKAMTLEAFVSKHLDLLHLEHEAEIDENRKLHASCSLKELQQRGVCILNLRLGGHRTGLYGRTNCTFEHFWGKLLPTNLFSSGDIAGVALSQEKNENILASGIVTRTTEKEICLSFDESFDLLEIDDKTQYRLMKLTNDVTYNRLKRTLLQLQKGNYGHSSTLVSVLFGDQEPSETVTLMDNSWQSHFQFFQSELNDSQKEAVMFALKQNEVAIVHGPPGTGKTTTVVEIILQTVHQRQKVLACAPSNVAVDNMVEKLSKYKIRLVRLGHPARILSVVQPYSLDALLKNSDSKDVINGLYADIDNVVMKIKKTKCKTERQNLRKESKILQQELKLREKQAVINLLKQADVVLSTLTSASYESPLKHLPSSHFQLVVIDECSQAVEAACWIPLLRAPRCVLAGDHLQLPPTITSLKAEKAGLSVSLMERLLELYGEKVTKMLTVQYRMHQDIMNWASEHMYQHRLISHPSVASHLLRDLPGVEENEDTSIPLLLIDTTGCGHWEMELTDKESKGNEGEADLVTLHVDKLIASGIRPEDIAIIAPYNLQVDLLKLRLANKYLKLEIKSVDGFQGQEKEVVILSLVRSNSIGEIGFLAENRRINVAVTRAKRHLAIVCDSETVSHNEFLRTLMNYITQHGDVRSAQQYEAELKLLPSSRPAKLHYQKEVKKTCESSTKQIEKPKARKKNRNKNKKEETSTKLASDGKYSTDDCVSTKESLHTSTDSENIRKEITDTLEKFVTTDSEERYSFPSTLTAFERLIVHEVAESLGLLHLSVGEKAERHITVEKKYIDVQLQPIPSTSVECVAGIDKQSLSKDSETKSSETSFRTGPSNCVVEHTVSLLPEKECQLCKKSVPSANFKLHLVQCERTPKQKYPKKTDVSSKLLKSVSDDVDLDTLLTKVKTADNRCSFPKCKQSIVTLGQLCTFCNFRYCLSHHIPEVHGCGQAAKDHARSRIRKEGKIYPGSGRPQQKPEPAKRAQLQLSLNKKISELSSKRKVNKP